MIQHPKSRNPLPLIYFNEPLPGQMTEREAHLKSHNEHESSDDLQYTQESGSSKESGSSTEYAQESPKCKCCKENPQS